MIEPHLKNLYLPLLLLNQRPPLNPIKKPPSSLPASDHPKKSNFWLRAAAK